jgi:hypothetical protein
MKLDWTEPELTVETHIHSNFSTIRGRLRRLAPIHQTSFQAIIEHLSRVAANSGQNKMDAKVSYRTKQSFQADK